MGPNPEFLPPLSRGALPYGYQRGWGPEKGVLCTRQPEALIPRSLPHSVLWSILGPHHGTSTSLSLGTNDLCKALRIQGAWCNRVLHMYKKWAEYCFRELCFCYCMHDIFQIRFVRGLLGTDPPDPTLESASPSHPQGSIWHRFSIHSTSIS